MSLTVGEWSDRGELPCGGIEQLHHVRSSQPAEIICSAVRFIIAGLLARRQSICLLTWRGVSDKLERRGTSSKIASIGETSLAP